MVVGTPIAGRNRAEVEKLIGFFANTLVLRTDLSSDPTFRELLARVRQTAMGAFAHQDLPFEKLVEELRPERDLSRNPLIQVIFALQNVPTEGTRIAGLETTPFSTGTQSAKLDLTLAVTEVSEGLRTAAVYNTDLFDGATIERMLQHYQCILEAALAHPDSRISELSVLTSEERHQLLVEWNSTEADYPKELCVHQLFEQQAERDAGCGGLRVRKYADHLSSFERASQPGRPLLAASRHWTRPVCGDFCRAIPRHDGRTAGQSKSPGAAYVPLDPEYPTERLRLTLEDAKLPLLLTQQNLLASMPEHSAQVRLPGF